MADPSKPRAAFAPWDRREIPGIFSVEETARRIEDSLLLNLPAQRSDPLES